MFSENFETSIYVWFFLGGKKKLPMINGRSLLQALHNFNQSNYDIWLLNEPLSNQWQGCILTPDIFAHRSRGEEDKQRIRAGTTFGNPDVILTGARMITGLQYQKGVTVPCSFVRPTLSLTRD